MYKLKLSRIRVIPLMLLVVMVFSTVNYADEILSSSNIKIGEQIGGYKKSNVELSIVTSNPYTYESTDKLRIPTYVVNNELYIVVEDLQFYGYSSLWDSEKRETRLFMKEEAKSASGTELYIASGGSVLYSDIKIFVDGIEKEALNIGGYSLVKASDLVGPNISFFREDLIESIKGTLSLPAGKVAPEGGVAISVVLLQDEGKGRSTKAASQVVSIKEGQSAVDYELKLTSEDPDSSRISFNYSYPKKYIAYEIVSPSNEFVGLNMPENHSVQDMELFVTPIDMYNENYNEVNMMVHEKSTVEVKTTLSGDIFELYGAENKRGIHMLFLDANSNERYSVRSLIPCDSKEFTVEVDLIKGRTYKLYTQVKSVGSLDPVTTRPPAPSFSMFSYVSGRGLIGEEAELIVMDSESKISQEITLPSVILGEVYRTDDVITVNGKSLGVYKVSDERFVSAQEAELYGSSISQEYNPETLEENQLSTSENVHGPIGQLLRTNERFVSNIHDFEVLIPKYWLDYYTLEYDHEGRLVETTLLNVNDLKRCGYEVKEHIYKD